MTDISVKKKILPVVAVVMLCAVSVIGIAYAYNASYSDNVDPKDVTPSENAKFLYITGSGLAYPTSDITATLDVDYTTETTMNGNQQQITATASSYVLTDLEGEGVEYADGVATIKIGMITVNDKNTGAQKAKVSVTGVTQTALAEDKTNVLSQDITAAQIFLKQANGAYGNVFEFSNNKIELEVYLVANVNTQPIALTDLTRDVTATGELDNSVTIGSGLAIPGFSISMSAAGDNIAIDGEMSSEAIADIKEQAALNPEITVTVSGNNGASIIMDGAAIATLGDEAAALEVAAVTTDLPDGVSAAYDISFGTNHFGSGNITLTIPYDGTETENVKIAYIVDGAVAEVYDAEVTTVENQKFVTFTTSHLSTYGIASSAIVDTMAVKLEMDGKTSYYNDFSEAMMKGRLGTSKITLQKDVTSQHWFGLRDVTDMTLVLNGKTLTAPVGIVYTDDVSASLTIDGTANGSKIVSENDTIVWIKATNGTHKFNLNVNGGTYEGDWAFIFYDGNSVSFTDATIEAKTAGIWCGNSGPKTIALKDVAVNSDDTGIYLGTVGTAVLTNVESKVTTTTATNAGSALEIKSGTVIVNGGTFLGGQYTDTNTTVNGNGCGGCIAAIAINNGYWASAGVDSVNVTLNNVTVGYSDSSDKPLVVVYTDTDEKAPGKDITLTWTGHDGNIKAIYNGTSSDIVINGALVPKA